MKKRIWELDALRGLCILGVIAVHLIFDVTYLYRLVDWQLPESFLTFQHWGGVIFVLLSGACATLGSRSVKRGLVVFGCGLVVTAVTAGMYFLNMASVGIIIYFGALHCLGVCMMLFPLFRKWKLPALLIVGAVLIAMGFAVEHMRSPNFGLYLSGLCRKILPPVTISPCCPIWDFSLWVRPLADSFTLKRRPFSPKSMKMLRCCAFCSFAASIPFGSICCTSPF